MEQRAVTARHEWRFVPCKRFSGAGMSVPYGARRHYGRERGVRRSKIPLRVAGALGLIAVRIGHPMIRVGTSMI